MSLQSTTAGFLKFHYALMRDHGPEVAILVGHIERLQSLNGGVTEDGHKWTYQTNADLLEALPWSERSLRTYLSQAVDSGVLIRKLRHRQSTLYRVTGKFCRSNTPRPANSATHDRQDLPPNSANSATHSLYRENHREQNIETPHHHPLPAAGFDDDRHQEKEESEELRTPGSFDAETATDEEFIAELMTYWLDRDTVIGAINTAAERSTIGTRQAQFEYARRTLINRRHPEHWRRTVDAPAGPGRT